MVAPSEQEVLSRYGVDLDRLRRCPAAVSAGLVRRSGLARHLAGAEPPPGREDCLVNILSAAGEEECLCMRFDRGAREELEAHLDPEAHPPERRLWLRSAATTDLCILFPR